MLHVSCVIIVVTIQFFQGVRLSKQELIGIFLAISGGILLTQNKSQSSREMTNNETVILTWESQMIGDLIAFLGSCGGIIYYHYNQKIGENLPVSCSCFYISLLGFLITVLFSMIFEGTEFFSVDSYNGIFGLFSKK